MIHFYNLLFAFISAILGTIMGFYISEPQRIPRWIALNKRSNWKGIWYCAWYPKLPNDEIWVIDKVALTHKLGKLHIKSFESSEGYEWECKMSLKGIFLIGDWKSLKPNSTSKGTMQLKISNQGNVIFGVATGPHINDRLGMFRFIFSDSEKALKYTIDNFDDLI